MRKYFSLVIILLLLTTTVILAAGEEWSVYINNKPVKEVIFKNNIPFVQAEVVKAKLSINIEQFKGESITKGDKVWVSLPDVAKQFGAIYKQDPQALTIDLTLIPYRIVLSPTPVVNTQTTSGTEETASTTPAVTKTGKEVQVIAHSRDNYPPDWLTVRATIKNLTSSQVATGIEVICTFTDGKGTVLDTQKTLIPQLKPGETQEVKFTTRNVSMTPIYQTDPTTGNQVLVELQGAPLVYNIVVSNYNLTEVK